MDDLISRQAAIKMCREPRMRNADCSDFEMEIMMLPTAEPKWIPITERLPELDTFVLTIDENDHYEVNCIDPETGDWVNSAEAWMPLPEPWKGGQNE